MEETSQESPFQSFFMGGFECSTKKFKDGRRIDVIRTSGHDKRCLHDYKLLNDIGIKTVRDGLRWHLIETAPGSYDWSSWEPMLDAALEAGTQVMWDLCHYGMPDYIGDFLGDDMPQRFADFSGAAAEKFRSISGAVPLWAPVNEISFWAYGAGSGQPFMWPALPGRSYDIKKALVRAAIASSQRLRAVDSRAYIAHIDPVLHITTREGATRESWAATKGAMYEAWDMLAGRAEPQLGGDPDLFDIVGCNFYSNNEWQLDPPSPTVELGALHYRPLHEILQETAERYNKPVFVSETGAEADNGPSWMAAMGLEARRALSRDVPLQGLCTYPAIDYAGWDNDRHCRTGFISLSEGFMNPTYDMSMVRSLLEQQYLMAHNEEIERQRTALQQQAMQQVL